jgi:hypothetical protein
VKHRIDAVASAERARRLPRPCFRRPLGTIGLSGVRSRTQAGSRTQGHTGLYFGCDRSRSRSTAPCRLSPRATFVRPKCPPRIANHHQIRNLRHLDRFLLGLQAQELRPVPGERVDDVRGRAPRRSAPRSRAACPRLARGRRCRCRRPQSAGVSNALAFLSGSNRLAAPRSRDLGAAGHDPERQDHGNSVGDQTVRARSGDRLQYGV